MVPYEKAKFSKSVIAIFDFFVYCSPFSYRISNFTIAKVVAPNRFASFFVSIHWFMASFLYCSSYIYRSFLILKMIVKSKERLIAITFMSEKVRQLSLSSLWARKGDSYRYRDSWESDNHRNVNKGKKQRN